MSDGTAQSCSAADLNKHLASNIVLCTRVDPTLLQVCVKCHRLSLLFPNKSLLCNVNMDWTKASQLAATLDRQRHQSRCQLIPITFRNTCCTPATFVISFLGVNTLVSFFCTNKRHSHGNAFPEQKNVLPFFQSEVTQRYPVCTGQF